MRARRVIVLSRSNMLGSLSTVGCVAARLVGGRGSNPEPHAVFFSHIFKFCSQNASSASGNEIQQRKKAENKGGGVEITWCKFQELKIYFKLCIWCVCILHSCAVKTDLRTAILLRSVLSGVAHDIVVCVCVCRGVGGVGGVGH